MIRARSSAGAAVSFSVPLDSVLPVEMRGPRNGDNFIRTPPRRLKIDLHTHLIPGVDDGARDLASARAAVAVLATEGVRAFVATPHVSASWTASASSLRRYFALSDAAREALSEVVLQFPGMDLHFGAEIMLDIPDPDLSDPRLRLGGTSSALIEFRFMRIPADAPSTVSGLRAAGVLPILAHPERYPEIYTEPSLVEELKSAGALLQLNSGCLVGAYGPKPQKAARHLLRKGWIDVVASDYHARGSYSLGAAASAVAVEVSPESADLLVCVNPKKILSDEATLPVPPYVAPAIPRWAFWRR